MTVASRLRNDAEMSLVAMIASIRLISHRVIQVWCRCAAEVNTSFSGQPSDLNSTPTIISLLRRACQISEVRRRHNFARSAIPIRAMPSGAFRPSHAAQNSFAKPLTAGSGPRAGSGGSCAGRWGVLMTVLVTGGAGYIGSHMVHALAEAGESVVVIDNLSTGFSNFLPEGVPLFIGDAADENLVEGVIAAHKVESIVHFAGSVVVPESMRDPLGYYRNNSMTPRSLLNVAVRSGVNRFIFSSTAAVYGNPDQVPVPENAPTRPLSP